MIPVRANNAILNIMNGIWRGQTTKSKTCLQFTHGINLNVVRQGT